MAPDPGPSSYASYFVSFSPTGVFAPRRLTLFVAVFFTLTAFPLSSAKSQYLVGGRPVVLDEKKTERVINLLTEAKSIPSKFAGVPKALFGDLYDKNLADLVVYFDANHEAHVALVRNGKSEKRLHGEPSVWVLVLSLDDSFPPEAVVTKAVKTEAVKTTEKGMTTTDKTTVTSTDSETVPTGNVEIRFEALEHRLTPIESIIGGVAAALSGVKDPGLASAGKVTKDLGTEMLPMRLIGQSGTRRLYYGLHRVPLFENTVNRVRVKPLGAEAKPKELTNAYATFGNYGGSRLGLSVALGAAIDVTRTADTPGGAQGTHSTEFDPYILGHAYIVRPRQPREDRTSFLGRPSFSFVLGTRLGSGSSFDDAVLGLSVGHFLGPMGIVTGVTFRSQNESSGRDRDARFLAALCFML